MAMLSPLEKRAINLTWAKPFDGNSPLLRYVLEVSENSKGLPPPWPGWHRPGRSLAPPGSSEQGMLQGPWGPRGSLAGQGTPVSCRSGPPPPSPPTDAPWTVLLGSVDPEATSVTVRGLVPARSYQFRLCAVNDVGRGQFSKDTER